MQFRIDGSILQTVTVELENNETVFSESGSMVWMSDNVSMESEMKGGIGGALGRMMSGESLFLIKFSASGKGIVTFANCFPGKILHFELKQGQQLICQKESFLAAQDSVTLKTHVKKKLGTGLLGGEGFILQKIAGPGNTFITIDGEVTEYELQQGQRLKVDAGCIAAMEPTVKFDITMMKGVKNMLFGGEGLFLATLEGPGKVWLQSMPVSKLAEVLTPHLPIKKK